MHRPLVEDVREAKKSIPRQQFDIAIQAAIGAKIVARETIKAVRKGCHSKKMLWW